MNYIKKFVGINLLILLVYTIILNLIANLEGGNEATLSLMVAFAFLVPIHAIVNVIASIVSFIMHEKEIGGAFLLSALVVSIIGFSTCWGNAMLYDSF